MDDQMQDMNDTGNETENVNDYLAQVQQEVLNKAKPQINQQYAPMNNYDQDLQGLNR